MLIEHFLWRVFLSLVFVAFELGFGHRGVRLRALDGGQLPDD